MTVPLLRLATALVLTIALTSWSLAAATAMGAGRTGTHMVTPAHRQASSPAVDLSFSLPALAGGLLFPGSAGPPKTCGTSQPPIYDVTFRASALLPGYGFWLLIC